MKRFQRILVPVDTRFEEHPALGFAKRLAEHNQAALTILEVVPELSWTARLVLPDADQARTLLAEEKKRKLETLAGPLRDQGLEVATTVAFGKTSLEIMHEVMRASHDLVVRVTKGAASQRRNFFGTTSLRLMRKCPCALWLVRPDTEPKFSTVLAAVDIAPNDEHHQHMNQVVMDLGRSVAQYEQGQLHVAHVWELFGGRMMRDSSWFAPEDFEVAKKAAENRVVSAFDAFLEPYGLDHGSDTVHLIYDEKGAGHGISNLGKRIGVDLIVLGTVARTGVPGTLIGNTAERVLDDVRCSVLTTKPDAFVSPVTLPDEPAGS